MTASDQTPEGYYLTRVVVPEIALFVSVLILIGFTRLCCPSVGGFLAFLVAACTLWLDRRLFALIPQSMWATQKRKAATYAMLGVTVVFAMLLLGALLAAHFSFGLFLVAWLVRLIVPFVFSLYWYRTFAVSIFPYLQSAVHQQSLESLDRHTALVDKQSRLADATKEADLRREDAERRNRRMQAIQEARRAVLNFYRSFAVALRPVFSGDRLQAELRAAIPDSASEEQAFAGACGLLTRLEGFVQGLETERKAEQAGRQQRRQQIAGIEAQIAALGEEISVLQRNTSTDPELRDAETQSLEAKRRSLLEQRAMLFARVS